ncbi:hypothetical protein C8R47DRAFT_1012819 [Mycena vitilis]|nr:hypothetical protein C8R47DRAFT_1012819 [Mycena vitilis]
MFGTIFHHYQPPAEPPPSQSTPADLPAKRGRGRPKGSKNKRKAAESVVQDSADEAGGPILTAESSQQPQKKKTRIDEVPHPSANSSASTKQKRGPVQALSNLLARGFPSRSRREIHTDASNTTEHSIPQISLPPTSSLNASALSASGTQNPATAEVNSRPSRSVLARANAEPSTNPSPATSLPATSSSTPVDFISDIDESTGSSAFLGGGLGEEEEADDENTKTPKRKPFPHWFQKIIKSLLDELKYDLEETTTEKSRHYLAGTFWLPRKPAWFALGHLNVKPTDLFLPDFFIWDPMSLLGGAVGIVCPECNSHHLTRDGVVERPRRVVDIDACFWIVGYTYACRKRSGGCGVRFRSWDQRILGRLPLPLAAEFPAHLTWRSGLSTRAFGVVRSCFQHGMGAEEVADLFRMQHLRRYDEIRLQYLRTKVKQMNLPGRTYEAFLPFDDRSASGFHGFTPSGQWLRDVYDDFIETYRDVLNQHTGMLSGRILAIDHSHKLAKHVFKVDGVPIFTGLLTVTNDKGEIKVCVLVATKSHSQFEDALRRLRNDLSIYGHDLPQAIYTDNMSDKPMLEKVFEMLLDKVTPVEKHAHLPLFVDPECVMRPSKLDDTTTINNVARSILDDLSRANDNHIVIGFGSEWNIDITPHGRLAQQGPPAVLQLAYKDQVHVLQIGEMLKRQVLPLQLLNLLQEPRVIKAGRSVNADLRRLATACGKLPGSFTGALELGNFAKDRFLIGKANLSLVDLVASILGQRFPPHYSERISSNWSDSDLTTIQQQYAARDAYAALCLYLKINETPLPVAMDRNTPCGASVLLLSDDNKKLAARGVISPAAALEMFNGANLTSTRTVITVQEILIPGQLLGNTTKSAHSKTTVTLLSTYLHIAATSVSCLTVTPNPLLLCHSLCLCPNHFLRTSQRRPRMIPPAILSVLARTWMLLTTWRTTTAQIAALHIPQAT